MADVVNKADLLPEKVVGDFINLVRGKSAIAELHSADPISFNGNKEFTFQFDKEVDIVAESGAKSKGGVTVEPQIIVPLKIEYSARFSDEFMYGTAEYQLNVLQNFATGFARKTARGLDIMAMHGFNPRTGTASALIATNHFDSRVTQTVAGTANADADMESAIGLVQGNDLDVTGAAISPAFRTALGQVQNGSAGDKYPQLAWGQNVGTINGLDVTANSTVAVGNVDSAIVGDFTSGMRWGYAKEIPIEVIEYGNPDNDATLGDLKGHNQILIRGEAYIGWGIVLPDAFARITPYVAPDPEA